MTWFWYSDTYSHGYYCQANNWCFIWLTYFVPASPYSSRNKGGLPRPPPRLEACPWRGLWWIPRRSVGNRRRKKHSGRSVLFSYLKLFFLFWMFLKSGLNSLWLCWNFELTVVKFIRLMRSDCVGISSWNRADFLKFVCWMCADRFEISCSNRSYYLEILHFNYSSVLKFRAEIVPTMKKCCIWNLSYRFEVLVIVYSDVPIKFLAETCPTMLKFLTENVLPDLEIPHWKPSYRLENPYWNRSHLWDFFAIV